MNLPQIEADPCAGPETSGPQKRGPKTAEGKARSSRNALKHGLRAKNFTILYDEDGDQFDAFAAEISKAFGPRDAVEAHFVDSIAIAMWREIRADGLEASTIDHERGRHLSTVVRYRAQVQGELRRAMANLDAYRARPRRDTPNDFPDDGAANQNTTNDFQSPETQTPPGSEPQPKAPQGSAEMASPENFPSSSSSRTNELTERLRGTVYHAKEPIPSVLKRPYWE